MPELPEVETVVRGLRRAVDGAVIRAVEVRRADLRYPVPANFRKTLEGQRVNAIKRRAKYVLIYMSNGTVCILHLGMSGRILIYPQEAPTLHKHDHLVLAFNPNTSLVFNDPRRFGFVDVAPQKNLENHKYFSHLGPEPLSDAFSPAFLGSALRARTIPIKQAIMDQSVVVGVGNIYACESLFRSGIDPRRPAKNIKKQDLERLVAAIKDVLAEAIAAGGSSLRDHRQTNGELGYFQHRFQVYGRAGEVIHFNGLSDTVQRIVQGGRATFFCPKLQK